MESVTREEYNQKEPSKSIETQNTENQTTREPIVTSSMRTQEGGTNLQLMKKNHEWSEDYITIPTKWRLEKCQD